MKISLAHKAALISLFASLLATNAFATTYNVSSLSDLSAKIAIANPGDTIIVANGVYSSSSSIVVNRDGAADAPITIEAESVGGVEISGSSGFSFSGASFIVIQGFKFTHASSISLGTSNNHIRITRCTIQLTIPSGGDVSYINISGDDMEIDHCELRNKSTLGEMLDISGSGSQVARRLWVHHNYFHDFTSPGGNGAETIRWGLSGLSLSTGSGLCEYNLFIHCDGENELISNKSSGNTYRFNTFLNSAGDQMSQRHGDNCVYYGNYFSNTDGLRVYGDNHQVYANYFANNSSGVDMGNGDGDVHNGDALTSHDRPDNCIVAYNTFVTNTLHYKMTGRTGGLGASNIMVFNNIFQGPGSAGSISSTGPYIGTWGGNILFGGATAGVMPSSGFTTVNPLLAADANGIFHLQAGSPAIGAGVSSFPFVRDDMDGQPRTASLDTGADEFSSAPILAKMLTTSDVGINVPDAPYLMSWEAEGLTPATSGPTTTLNSDQNASGWAWFGLNATAAGDFIEFTTKRVPAGTYSVRLSYKVNTSRGTLQVSVDGSDVGAPLDQFGASTAYLEQTFGTVTFATTGSHSIRLTVTGKNASSSAFTISADRITLAPATAQPVAAPTFNPGAGTYSAPQSVTISTTTGGASIRYTTDGSTPTSATGTLYSGPVTVSVSTTLKAIAFESGLIDSSVTSSNYTISIPNFTISATPGSQTVTAGTGTTYTVNVGNVNGFSGSVALSASGLPAGATATFNPASVNSIGSSTLTVNTTTSTPPGTYTVTITGTSGSLVHSTTVSLVVNPPPPPDFSLSASPASVTVVQGGNGTSTITVNPVNGFAGSVSLSASGLPSGVTASFNPASATTSSALTLTASGTATTGTATVTVTGTSGSLTHTTTISLTVQASTSLPAGWSDNDIGAVGLAGSATFTSGTFTVKGSGADIWTTADQFNYASESITGNQTITARVVSESATGSFAKAGVMIRESTATNAVEVSVLLTPTNGVAMQVRSTTGAASINVTGWLKGPTPPSWVRLVRSGSTFTSYRSTDGVTWTLMASTNVTMATSATAGLAVTSHDNTALNTAAFSNVTVAPTSTGTTVSFEAESVTMTNSGVGTTLQSDVNSSNGAWISLNSTATGQWIEFTTPSITAGTYAVSMMWKGNNNRGQMSLTVDGAAQGATLDQYSATQSYPTTAFGTITFAAAGTHKVRLTVTGKNASSSGFVLAADKFTFTAQ
jgi:poly(beta-D-mannuronate) lyase